MKTPQQLRVDAIEKFKNIHLEEFGQILSDDEVHEIALRLLQFFGISSQPFAGKAHQRNTKDEN
jgi:hypothetical protein